MGRRAICGPSNFVRPGERTDRFCSHGTQIKARCRSCGKMKTQSRTGRGFADKSACKIWRQAASCLALERSKGEKRNAEITLPGEMAGRRKIVSGRILEDFVNSKPRLTFETKILLIFISNSGKIAANQKDVFLCFDFDIKCPEGPGRDNGWAEETRQLWLGGFFDLVLRDSLYNIIVP